MTVLQDASQDHRMTARHGHERGALAGRSNEERATSATTTCLETPLADVVASSASGVRAWLRAIAAQLRASAMAVALVIL
ncbi:hypothetical protein [Dactylosporangium sp. NPDC048998]|uniref:hypothetical protein n=1 Tax=Dactylosporangium sp. NPDC048998 TaxID=3363976 RepID=UPI003719A750